MEICENILENRQNLAFIKYDKDDPEQYIFLEDMRKDNEISKYIYDIVGSIIGSSFIENNPTIGFLIKDNSIPAFIGLCIVNEPVGYDKTAVSIKYAVHSQFRSTENKYGSKILLNVGELLFETNSISKIVLEIRGENIASREAALNAGFDIDYDLLEKFIYERYNYLPYSKGNYKYHYKKGIVKTKDR